MPALPTRDDAVAMDATDKFAAKRAEFVLEDGAIYMCGNSLGPMPVGAIADMKKTMKEDWAKGLITSQNKAGWFMMTDTLGDRLAKMIGAGEGEVVVSDSTGINIYKVLHAAISIQPGRKTIILEADSFPTDIYMAEGVTSLLSDMTIKLEGRDGDKIEDMIDDDTAAIVVNQVDYRSGVVRDIKALTKLAHASGAMVISDLCHSAGCIPVDLRDDNVDFAVGCTYKYLNAGPGAPAYAYAAKRHHGKFKQPLTGWHGHANPFGFELSYRQGKGARALLTGSQPTLSAIGVRAGLDVYEGVDIAKLYEKGQALSNMFISLIDEWCGDFGIGFFSPKAPEDRAGKVNGQVALTHDNGFAVMQALIARGVTGDFRQPNVMRFGFTPLYLRYVDVWDAAQHLREIMETEEWKEDRFSIRSIVT